MGTYDEELRTSPVSGRSTRTQPPLLVYPHNRGAMDNTAVAAMMAPTALGWNGAPS